MKSSHDDPRRDFLLRALGAGLLAAAPPLRAGLLGRVPRQLPPGQSIYSLQGDVKVNGVAAEASTRIRASDRVSTGAGAQAIFVVGQEAFLLRENSSLELQGENWLVGGLRLASGALLSVFGRGRYQVAVPTATIGIRGTGLYLEADTESAYICTCYGITDIAAASDADSRVTVESRHHDAAKRVTADGRILPAPFVNHSDEELMLIETLVGRTPPFALFDDSYGGPRRY